MLVLGWQNEEGIARFADALRSLGDARFRTVGARVVNRTGDMARTQVRRNLTKQTGLQRRTIVKAVRVTRANTASMVYVMRAKGGDVSLKYFKARETRRGVSAAPFGQRKVFASTFIKGGRFPERVSIGKGGHVFARSGAGRTPIIKQKSGVVIPTEMVTGATRSAFETSVRMVLPQRLAHELRRMTGAAFS
ncbi:MAG: phage tail protein [Mesorhizobium sp.]|nr:phage tail protein [Mesorhizobium sp.]